MIVGVVTAEREALIRLIVQGPSGQTHEIEAVIDTGFTDFLTLPHSLVAALGLAWLAEGRATLANGQVDALDVYAAAVVWDGHPIRIIVDSADTVPLVGMKLMYGCDINIQDVDGGAVCLTRRVGQPGLTGV
jgi:clan AA aspartic protease